MKLFRDGWLSVLNFYIGFYSSSNPIIKPFFTIFSLVEMENPTITLAEFSVGEAVDKILTSR